MASAAAARVAALPDSFGACSATSRISSSLPLQWSTISQPAASAACVRSAVVPDSAPMAMSSLISSPSNPMNPRITSRTIVAEVVAGASGSMSENTTWAVIAIGSRESGWKAAKSRSFELLAGRLDHRQPLMAVGIGAAVAGDVLEHRQHAARHQARRHRAADRGDLLRRAAIGAVADHGIGAARRNIGDRQAVDVDSERQEIAGDQPRAETRGGQALRHVAVVDPSVGGRRSDSTASAADRGAARGRPPDRSAPAHWFRPPRGIAPPAC